MSMELDSPQLTQPNNKKKPKDSNQEKGEKKRKRQISDDLELASSTKRHRSKHQSDSTTEATPPSIPSELPTVSPFFQQSSSLYLPLPPITQKHALKGLCAEHLSPLILTYYPPFHGVIVSYRNVRLSTDPHAEDDVPSARAIDEYAASFIWLTADFLVFRPHKDDVIEGWVNLQNESNIGLLCLNFFNATIERKRLSKTWKWIPGGLKPPQKKRLKKAAESSSAHSDEDSDDEQEEPEHGSEDAQGYFQDAHGKKVEGFIRFTVRNVETSRSVDRETGFLNLQGTMLSEEDERKLQELEAMRIERKGKEQPRRIMTGALTSGLDGAIDIDQPKELTPSRKHRAKY